MRLLRLLAVIILCMTVSACGGTPAATPETSATRAVSTSATDTPIPPAEPTDTAAPPTETSAPPTPTEAAVVFDIGEPATYKSKYSQNLTVVGVITYTGTVKRGAPNVIVTLTDASGAVLGTSSSYISPSFLKPNSIIPFNAGISSPPEKWDKIEVDVEAQPFTSFDESFAYGDLEIVDSSMIKPSNEFEGIKIVGRVKNTGNKVSYLTQIIAVTYDADGKVTDVGSGFSKIDEIAAGADSPFEISFLQAKDAAKYELVVTGRPK